MSTATVQLEAGGLLPAGTHVEGAVDAGAVEQVVARTYRHPALGGRAVVRLASDRLGQAEDLAMEFLGFTAPEVSPPVALQQRRSLSFAAWALINDPKNARYALDLVKRMKAAARLARSKPGHAWDAYMEMAKDLGRSARHFLPPFWEEVGRTYKDLGNQTYAGRALTKSLEAERVHALEADRARRRDVVLEFVLSGCLAGSALSEYGSDLPNHYAPDEAYAIFRDLCVRRTRGGMAPWATLPKDLIKLAKAAGLDGDQELEKWLEEVIEAPAMGRAPYQFWKTCGGHCRRVVARSPAFAVALLRHTRPEPRYWGESKLGPWLALLEEWGVLDYLWEDGRHGAPPLGEPVAVWFGRIVRDEVPAPKRTLDMLDKLTPRLQSENAPVPLSISGRFGSATEIDIDVLEACLSRGIKVDDPPAECQVTFAGWLAAEVDHPLRNQDVVASGQDERYRAAVFHGLGEALACRGGTHERGYRQTDLEQRPFPLAAGDRPGIKELWRRHTAGVLDQLERAGLASFEMAHQQLQSTLWPETLRLFPDLGERLQRIDPVAVLRRTLQAGVFDEYGLPAFEQVIDQGSVTIQHGRYGDSNIFLTFPSIVVSDKVHAHVIGGDGKVARHELRLPKKCELVKLVPVGDDLAVNYRDQQYNNHFFWTSDPGQKHDTGYESYGSGANGVVVTLRDGSFFLGQKAVRPGDKQMPAAQDFFHDGERFWRQSVEYDEAAGERSWKCQEIDPQTGKATRESVPPWFEETDGGTIDLDSSELLPAPAGAESTPLGTKGGLLGWKALKRRDGSYFGQGIDGRRWDKPLSQKDGSAAVPVGLLRQPGTDAYLPVAAMPGGTGTYWLWDPSGTTAVAELHDFAEDFAWGQVALLPLLYWHLLKLRDEASSRKLRAITHEQCAALLQAAAEDRAGEKARPRGQTEPPAEEQLANLLPAVTGLLPTAPRRLVLGVARLVERAGREGAAFAALRDTTSSEAARGTGTAAAAGHRKSDLAAAHWGLESISTYGSEGEVSLSAHLGAAADFLKGSSPGGELPGTNYLWFPMLEGLPLRCWQTLWRVAAAKMGKKDGGEVAWLDFLKHWHECGLAELPGHFDTMEGHPEGVKKNSWGGYDLEVEEGHSFTLQNGDDRFIIVANENYGSEEPYQLLRYSTAKNPGPPPGYRVKNVRKVKAKADPADVAAFIAAVEASTGLPLPSREELVETATNVSASPAEIGLIWIGGLNLDSYQHNFLPAELRTALGMKTTEANAARQALRNLNGAVLTQLYEAVVAEGLAAPFAADRGPVLRSVERVWQTKMPRRLHLDAPLQKRLAALGRASPWSRDSHEELLAVAAEPAKHPLLQPRDIEIRVKKDRSYGSLELQARNKKDGAVAGDFLRSLVQLVALVHAETPAGHPARAAMPALIKQTARLLDEPGTLLDLRGVYLYGDGRKKLPTPSEWLAKHVGKTRADGKDGTARLDDGFLVAAALDGQNQALVGYRPKKLRDNGDMARLLGILAVGVADEDDVQEGGLPVVAVIKGPGFQKLAKALPAKELEPGRWPQDPRRTAPAVVQAVQKKLKLGEDAAVLYAQLLALPEPTTANVCAWNGWTAGRFKSAAAELVGHKLVLQATRARAGRSFFLPGEWAELKAPWLPVETWKVAHLVELDMDPREPCPAGGPMVLRPFEDLFAAAWQRVLDGDEPRYEEVKRKKAKK